jgi:hypothetical protein
VFASANGKLLDASNRNRRFGESLDGAGLPRQRFHNQRHLSPR